MAMVTCAPKAPAATGQKDGRSPMSTKQNPLSSSKFSTPSMRRRGPPHALMIKLPANIPAPAIEMMAPSTSLDAQPRIMGMISAPTMPQRKLTAAKKSNRLLRPGRAEM